MLQEAFENFLPISAAYESRDMSVVLYLLSKQNNWKVMILGEGNEVTVLKTYMKKRHNLEILYVFSEQDIIEHKLESNSNWIIFNVYKAFCDSEAYKNIIIKLLNENINGMYKLVDMNAYIYDQFYVSFVSFFLNEKEKMIKNENIWADEKSKKIYVEYITSFLEGRTYQGETLKESSKYFGLDDIHFFDIPTGTSWINVGAATGDTIFWQYCNDKEFENIYAIEGDSKNVDCLRENLSIIGDKKVKIIPHYCGMREEHYKLDEIHDNISLINMDIEGNEKEALMSAKRIIQNCKPILAICVYHLADDLIEIPRLISAIDDSYIFYLRKYMSGTGRHYHAVHKVNELVLYGISKMR